MEKTQFSDRPQWQTAGPQMMAQVEKTLVAEILNHLGYLLIAKSPLKSKVKDEAERYRGELLSSLDVEQRKPFLQSRDIVVELAKLLAKCQDRAMLGKTLTFIQSLSQGEVLIVEDDPNEAAMRQRLADHLEFLYGFQTRPDELNQIVNIVRNLTTSHEL